MSTAVTWCLETKMSPPDGGRNLIIATLSQRERAQLASINERVPLDQGAVLHRFGSITTRYIFPLSGAVSLTVPTPAGDNVEVALVGRQGVTGISSLLGNPTNDLEAIAQMGGEAVAVSTDALTPELRSALRPAFDRYAATLLTELAQTAACSQLHSVEKRTARWLLHAADRAERTDLKLTHEFVAMMLGVRRASVTVVVGGFVAAGLIIAERRRISVHDRDGLRGYACSCYEIIRRATASAYA